jgi:GTP cyclohydrolase I
MHSELDSQTAPDSPDGIEGHVRNILKHMGEDPDREGLLKTPYRVARAFEYLTKGYQQDPKEVINNAIFTEEDYSEMIVVKDIDFFSMCEHHILPFFGRANVAYIPNKRIVGISKVARLVDVYARRLQVQERITTQVANTLMEELNPLGVGVIITAEHLCMRMRGVEKQNSIVTTSATLGAFRTHQETREEFITLVNGRQR